MLPLTHKVRWRAENNTSQRCCTSKSDYDTNLNDEAEEPVELNHHSARQVLTCFVSSRVGDFYSDATLESATVVMFAYPGDGPAYGKSRTPSGASLLDRLRLQSRTSQST